MNTNVLPVIFLAFANDYEGGYGYLPALASERRNLQVVLDRAQQNGLCEVVLRSDTTLDDLVGVFQDARYRGRIAIFHFGGHADAYKLLLQTADGKRAAAYADGLAAFLGRQPNLQLIFLNGCSTQPHVEGLHAAGIPAVIATNAEIDDQLAGDFALRFYQGLATGATIESAYHTAEAAGRTANAEVRAIMEAGYLPWALSVRAGAEAVADWSLPEAAENPLFGLPPLPPGDLPAQPFRNILWFRREDAPIFSGRGYDIRALYQRVTAPGAAPIVLYYGQSGVGKSSLLAAGLLPRLEQVHTVVYTRRDQALGLTGTLAAMLAANLLGSIEASWKVSTADLPFHWRAIESETGKPLTVILDQVEEVYTRPNETMPDEMDAFLVALVALFADSTARPQGRLILSFRKEYLAEIEKLVAERYLPHTRVFLQRLDRRGIIEAVTGPARSERQRQHFGLSMEDGLAAEIADDLLADPSSAVAPTLQILLSKLWEQAKARAYDHPHFDRTLYHDLRRKGLLLSDFLDQQLAMLRTRQPAAVESGLALDLLAFHTTPLGTAEQRTLAELRTMYAHQSMTLDGLLAACRDLYLLIDPAENRPDAVPDARITRLAHDTLAPLVRHRFEESDAPGQRARRILESRAVDWEDGKEGAPLDETDLTIVETGKPGMRGWQPDEDRLIQASYSVHAQRKAERERIQQERAEARQREQAEREARAAADARADQERKNAGKLRRRAALAAMAAALALVLFMIAIYLFNNARIARDDEAVARATAELNEQAAIHAKATAEVNEQQARVAEATAVAAKAEAEAAKAEVERLTRAIRADQLTANALAIVDDNPPLALLLAVEGLRNQLDFAQSRDLSERQSKREINPKIDLSTTASRNEIVITSAQTKLHELLSRFSGMSLPGHRSDVSSAAFSPDNRWLATASFKEVHLWDLADSNHDETPFVLPAIGNVSFSPDNRWLMIRSSNGVFAWNLQREFLTQTPFQLSEGDSWDVVFSPDGRWVAVLQLSHGVRLWDLKLLDANPNPVLLIDDSEFNSISQIVAFSPDSRWLWLGGSLWKLTIEPNKELWLSLPVGDYAAVQFSSDSNRLAVQSGDDVRLFDLASPQRSISTRLLSNEARVTSFTFSADNRWLATATSEGIVRLWSLASNNPTENPVQLPQTPGSEVQFSPDSKWMVTGGWLSEGGDTIRLWNLLTPEPATNHIELLHESSAFLHGFSPDGRWLATSSGTTVRLWNLASDVPPQVSVPLPHSWHPEQVSFSSDSSWLATQSTYFNQIFLWDLTVTSPASTPILLAHENHAKFGKFSPNGRWFVSAADRTGWLWDLNTIYDGKGSILVEDDGSVVGNVAFSTDGHRLATGSGDRKIRIWDTATMNFSRDAHLLSLDSGFLPDVIAFSPDDRWLAATSHGGKEARLWDLNTSSPNETPLILAHQDEITDLAFSLDSHLLVTASKPGGLYFWSLADQKIDKNASSPFQPYLLSTPAFRPDGRNYLSAPAFGPDGRWLATGNSVGIQLWDAAKLNTAMEPITMQRAGSFHGDSTSDVVFSPNGNWVAAARGYGEIWLWRLDSVSSALEPVVLSENSEVRGIAFSPDSRWLATSSGDNTIRVWNIATRSTVLLRGHTDSVSAVTFSPNGLWIASRSDDGTARVWTWDIDELMATACRIAGRNLTAAEWRSYFEDATYRRTCEQWPAHFSVALPLLDEAKQLAMDGDIEGAMARFEQALTLDPSLDLNPESEAKRTRAPIVADMGYSLAQKGDIEGAIAKFEESLRLDPLRIIEPEIEAKRIWAFTLESEGFYLAREGNVEGAIGKFEDALKFDPTLELVPETYARDVYVSELVQQGLSLSQDGNISGSVEKFSIAQEFDPLRAQIQLWDKVIFLASTGAYFDSITMINAIYGITTTVDVTSTLPAEKWNSICWRGTLSGVATEIMPTCMRAVTLAPEHGSYRDSRGLARALTGDAPGAIEDFRFFVAWARKTGQDRNVDWREEWIARLEAGESPAVVFDAATLEHLRNE